MDTRGLCSTELYHCNIKNSEYTTVKRKYSALACEFVEEAVGYCISCLATIADDSADRREHDEEVQLLI